MQINFEEEIDKMNKHAIDFRVARESFIKQVLVMATAFLGILISLHKMSSINQFGRLCFATGLVNLAIGIILLALALYSQVSINNKLYKNKKEEILSRLNNPNFQGEFKMINTHKVFQYSEIVGYIALAMGVVSITLYGVIAV